MEHSWECVAQLLRECHTTDILCDVGMPVIHRGLFLAGAPSFIATVWEPASMLGFALQVSATIAAFSC